MVTTAAEHAALILYRPLQILRYIELLLNFISFTKYSNNRRNENEFNQLTLYFTGIFSIALYNISAMNIMRRSWGVLVSDHYPKIWPNLPRACPAIGHTRLPLIRVKQRVRCKFGTVLTQISVGKSILSPKAWVSVEKAPPPAQTRCGSSKRSSDPL